MSSVQKSLPAAEVPALMPFARMRIEDLPEVQQIENDAYPYPWSPGNFRDSIKSGYEAWIVRETSGGALAGYFLLMIAVDETHLLNITVRRDLHGRGLGRMLLDKVVEIARSKRMASVLLEVRPSNARALSVYQAYGFSWIGRRKGYYPAADNTREDAIVMKLAI